MPFQQGPQPLLIRLIERARSAPTRRARKSSIATVSTVTRNTAPGCPEQHRHFAEFAKGSKSRRKTNVGNGIRAPATTADGRPTTTIPSDETNEMRNAMNSLLEQKLWKWKLVAGLLTVVMGGIVLAWPGPTILVASTLFGVYLLLTGFTELFLAFTLPRSAATRVLLFISGALSLVLAVLSFRHFGDAYAILLLSIWIGIGFYISRRFGGRGLDRREELVRAGLVRRSWRHLCDRRLRRSCLAIRFNRRACARYRRVACRDGRGPDRSGISNPQGREDRARSSRLCI